MAIALVRTNGVDGLIERFPQFVQAPVTLVNEALIDAAARTNDALYPNVTNATLAGYMRAALTLYRSPFAIKMRLNSPENILLMERDLRGLQRSSTMGLRVFGNGYRCGC